MPQRDLAGSVTHLQMFRPASEDPSLGDRLRGYVRGQEGSKGLTGGTTLRLLAPGAGYVRLDRWEGMHALLRSTHAESHLPRLADAAGSARVDAHLMVSVGRMPAQVPLTDAGLVTLIRASVAERAVRFEMDFGALVGRCVTSAHYGGSELLRSVTDPRSYTGLLWWRPATGDRTESGDAQRAAGLSASARVTQVHAVPVGDA
ncbi:hypothetical protein ACIBI4_22490 [Streptomyces sp. NPDC050418]|uniref:hypothetical protein n=1 Tax=Streptomyces sp. NPDC050418 TaxID=3365612 RepID=UPI0037BB3193